jgi:hypothetical protein
LKLRRKKEMAKVINPLLSGSASGQLGHMMTFDKRGFVRQYVTPSNPQTDGQMAVRNALGDFQRSLKLLGAILRAELKSQFGYRWNSVIVGELMANDKAAYTAYLAEFNAFQAGEKTAWASADTSAPIALTDGAVLYACASAVYDIAVRLGATVSLTLPAAANSATVAGEWTANA